MKRTMPTLALIVTASLAFATPREAMVMQINSAIGSLEPAQAVVTYDVLPVQQMFEGLFMSDAGTAKGLLASRVQQSSDGKVSTFSLRRNVKFHDGSSMTCNDVEYSLRRTFLVGNETSQAAQVRANILAIAGFTPEVKKTDDKKPNAQALGECAIGNTPGNATRHRHDRGPHNRLGGLSPQLGQRSLNEATRTPWFAVIHTGPP